MNVRKIIILLSVILLCLLPYAVHADSGIDQEDRELWRELNKTSDTILQYVKEQRYEEAKQLLNHFSKQFLTVRSSDFNLSMNDLRVIVSTYESAEQASTSMSMSHEDRVRAVSSFRLLVDVYDSSEHHLWKNTKESLESPLTGMAEAFENEDWTTYQKQLNRFLKGYEVVRPAWQAALEPHVYQRFDSQVVYAERHRHEPLAASNLLSTLSVMLSDLDMIYGDVDESTSDPSLIWVILTIGGAIVFALTYAGWKKYEGQREERKVRRRE
ncbi:sporulation protein YpjB [Alteribacter keqinensis]|uniref:Sporulation protein YpjB n=1 Tax=Alteribacter keqinensis TaxID=2483800 RepID=A0A3M7TW80_9BACI|nr:sporulation protein YpjB [Alteribacter keqinensis]RNA69162.1 sporulation protein YpjB [Alteribacter keqinensis]